MTLTKPKRYENKEYSKYIESLFCLVRSGCWGDVVGHHTDAGGTSTKCSDHDKVPLCYNHHTGDLGVHVLGKQTFQGRFNLDFTAEKLRLMKNYYERQGEDNEG